MELKKHKQPNAEGLWIGIDIKGKPVGIEFWSQEQIDKNGFWKYGSYAGPFKIAAEIEKTRKELAEEYRAITGIILDHITKARHLRARHGCSNMVDSITILLNNPFID